MKLTGIIGHLSSDLAVDLGTANTRIYAKDKGIVLNEPSIVAVAVSEGSADKAIAYGFEAKDMQGKTPGHLKIVRPIREGVIADFDAIAAMLKFFISKVHSRYKLVKPRIAFAVPHAITEVEKRAIRETAEMVGARETFLVSGPIATAIGAGLPVREAICSMIVDIGAGKTEAAAMSLLGIVQCQSTKASGDRMDFALSQFIKNRYQLIIGDLTAENIKTKIGNFDATTQVPGKIEIKGRDPNSGIPKVVEIETTAIWKAIAGQIDAVVQLIKAVLEKIPPELSSDVIDKGIMLTGGVAMLGNLRQALGAEIGLKVNVASEPMSAAVLGAGYLLESDDLLPRVTID
jgi:rod shape-determining protein MreB